MDYKLYNFNRFRDELAQSTTKVFASNFTVGQRPTQPQITKEIGILSKCELQTIKVTY